MGLSHRLSSYTQMPLPLKTYLSGGCFLVALGDIKAEMITLSMSPSLFRALGK